MQLYMVGYATPVRWLPLVELEKRWDWGRLHPELRRRLVALMDASEGRVGFGGGWRSSELQATVFKQRHRRVTYPTSLWYDGSFWELIPPNAPAAPPGLSFHESTLDGWALAADLIGDLDWVGAHAGEFWLRDFSDVNNEPWHVQPVDIPGSRRKYDLTPELYPIAVWNPVPAPVPDPGGEDMFALHVLSEGHRYLWTPGGRLMWLSPTDADATVAALVLAGVKVGQVEWSRDQRVAANNGGYYVAAGSA